jgi:hypothetical protein
MTNRIRPHDTRWRRDPSARPARRNRRAHLQPADRIAVPAPHLDWLAEIAEAGIDTRVGVVFYVLVEHGGYAGRAVRNVAASVSARYFVQAAVAAMALRRRRGEP